MARNTFYATSTSNSSLNGLLNGGEDSWGRSASAFSENTLDMGYFTYNMSSIRSTIPSVATISSVEFSIQMRQSRSALSLYYTILKSQLYVGSTSKSSQYTSPKIANTYEQKVYGNTVAISSSELHSQDLRVRYQAIYKGTLSADQYAKDLKCDIIWEPINTTALSINKTSTTLNKGTTETLTVTRTPSAVSYPTISWTSSNTAVATVNSSGVVTAVGNGTATITAKTTDGTNISKTCSVTVRTPVTGVSISPATLSLNVGGTYTLAKNITPSDASNQNMTWSSNNTNVASVDNDGKVTAVGKGTCSITCISNENTNLKGNCSVTVIQQATGITISPANIELEIGGTSSVNVSVIPTNANNKNYTLSSSNTKIATVSNGIVTGIATGNCNIIATSEDGKHTAKCYVNVKNSNIFNIAKGNIITENMILGSTTIRTAYIGSTLIYAKK